MQARHSCTYGIWRMDVLSLDGATSSIQVHIGRTSLIVTSDRSRKEVLVNAGEFEALMYGCHNSTWTSVILSDKSRVYLQQKRSRITLKLLRKTCNDPLGISTASRQTCRPSQATASGSHSRNQLASYQFTFLLLEANDKDKCSCKYLLIQSQCGYKASDAQQRGFNLQVSHSDTSFIMEDTDAMDTSGGGNNDTGPRAQMPAVRSGTSGDQGYVFHRQAAKGQRKLRSS